MVFEPCEGSADHAFLPAMVNGFEGLPIGRGCASFDFGEDGGLSVLSDDVDFAKVIAKTRGKNAIAMLPEELNSGEFSAGTENMRG